MTENATAREVCRAALSLVRALGKQSVAEGVENLKQAAFLNDLQCRLGQGYLWARPMPEMDLIAWWQPRASGFQNTTVTV